MDPITALALTGNILQFIDFGLKATSKARDIYHSADGVTVENANLESLTVDIAAVTTKLADSSTQTSGNNGLDDICRQCTKSAEELLAALGKLKVEGKGQKSKWKSVRMGLKAVWGKKKVEELRARLEGWRDEIQFHVVVQLRIDIDVVTLLQSERFDTLNQYAKSLLVATSANEVSIRGAIHAEGEISDKRNTEVQDLVAMKHIEMKNHIQDTITVESELSDRRHENITAMVLAKGKEVQKDVRDAMLEESDKSDKRHEQTKGAIVAKQTEVQVEITQAVGTLDSNIRAEQESTRLELEQLRTAMAKTEEDMARRDDELKVLLLELSNSKNETDRKRLRERSNAVATAIYALVTVYESLQKMFVALQAQAKLAIASTSLATFWSSRTAGYCQVPNSTIDQRMIVGLLNRPSTMRHGRNRYEYEHLTGGAWSSELKGLTEAQMWKPTWNVLNTVRFSDLAPSYGPLAGSILALDEGHLVGSILDILDFNTGSSRFNSFAELRFGCEPSAEEYELLTSLIIISTGLAHALNSSEAAAREISCLINWRQGNSSSFQWSDFDRLVSSWAIVGEIAGFRAEAIEMLQARCIKWGINNIETANNSKGVAELFQWLFMEHEKGVFTFNVVSVDGGRGGGAALFAIIEYFIHFGFRLDPPVMVMTRYGLLAHICRHGVSIPAEDDLPVPEVTSPMSRMRSDGFSLESRRFRREQRMSERIQKEADMIEAKIARSKMCVDITNSRSSWE